MKEEEGNKGRIKGMKNEEKKGRKSEKKEKERRNKGRRFMMVRVELAVKKQVNAPFFS